MKNLIIFHHVAQEIPCRDGLVTAWVINKALPGDNTFVGWQYKQNDKAEYPDVTDYDLIAIGDFHFPVNVLKAWRQQGKKIILIDHHKTTMESFGLGSLTQYLKAGFYYDVQECGATLAWKYFYPNCEMPAFLAYIRDRDLYTKKLPYIEEIHSAFGKLIWKGSLERAFETLDALSELSLEQLIEQLVPIGEPIYRKRQEKISGILARNPVTWIEVEGHKVPMISLKKSHEMYRSDIGEILYKLYSDVPFVVIKKATGGYSLRSDQNGNNFDLLSIGVSGHSQAGSIAELKYTVL